MNNLNHRDRMSKGHLSRLITGLVYLSMIASGCGDDGFDPKSVLSSYRVIALRADPPQLTLTSSKVTSSVLSLYDFHPKDLSGERPNIEYKWRLCPFSLGSVTQYDCLLDEIELDQGESQEETQNEQSDSDEAQISARPDPNAQLTLNPAELLATLLTDDLEMQMEQLERGAGMLGSEMNFFASGLLEVYLKLTVKIDGEEEFELVKSMTILLNEEIEPNQNPSIDQVISAETLDQEITLPSESEWVIEATATEDSAERYQVQQSADALESGLTPQVETETLLMSYYTTSGRFDQAVKLIDDTETTLTVGEESGDQLLFVVLRDGRGGVDLRRIGFKVD